MARSRRLTYLNKESFFIHVKPESIYSFNPYDFNRTQVSVLASKYGVEIERGSSSYSFRIVSVKEPKSHKPALFDPKMLVVD